MASKLQKLLTAGFDARLRGTYGDAMRTINSKTAHMLSICGTVLGFVMMCYAYMRPHGEWGAMPFFLVVTLAMLLCAFTPNWEQGATKGTVWLYTTVATVYASIALYSLLVTPQQRSVGICLALAVLPSLILDAGWRTLLPGLITSLLYVPLRVMNAPQNKWSVVGDVVLSFIIGILVANYHLRGRAREIVLRDSIVGERDTDPLTKVMRRGAAEQRIRDILENVARPCVMIMVDVDNFKSVNDTYGHGYGDLVLEEISALLRRSFRSGDVVCRLGGDEFMVFVVGAPEGEWLKNKANEILQQLASSPIPGRHDFYASISMGAVYSPQYGTDYEKLYLEADRALYEAKRQGKNQCCLFGEEIKSLSK